MIADYFVLIVTIVGAFLFGKVLTQQKAHALLLEVERKSIEKALEAQAKLSELSFGASVWSLCEAKALRSGAIIQRVIEKVHVVEDKEKEGEQVSKEIKKTNEAFDAAIEGLKVKRNRVTGTENFNPEDLV